MNEYFALIVPAVFALLLIIFFSKRVTWWEMLLPVVVGLIVIFSMKSCDQRCNVTDTEYVSQHVIGATHNELWNEWIVKTCSRRYACGTETYSTGSGKNRTTSTRTKYCTEYYDCSYCKTHPPEWYMTNDRGERFDISEVRYNELVKQWGNQRFVNLNHKFYTVNGNRYEASWDLNIEHLITTHSAETYENRTQASHSIYNFTDVSDSDRVLYHVFEYPKIDGYSQDAIMAFNYPVSRRQQDYANAINGLLGQKKQVQYFVCVWKGMPFQASVLQQQYWKGGNKNELIVCVGLDNANNVSWWNVVTWSERELLKVQIRDYVLAMKGRQLDLRALTDFSYRTIDGAWQRKNFHDFDFLEVELTDAQVDWIYIIVILMSLGLSVFAVVNNVDPEYQTNDAFAGKIKEIYENFTGWIRSVFKRK